MDTRLQTLLTIEEVFGYLNSSPRTIYRLVHSGELPALRVGREWRFRGGGGGGMGGRAAFLGGGVEKRGWGGNPGGKGKKGGWGVGPPPPPGPPPGLTLP